MEDALAACGGRGGYDVVVDQGPEAAAAGGWAPDEWGLLAPSPDWFAGCGAVTVEGGPVIQRPARTSHMGQQGIVIPNMPSEHFNKYRLMLLFSSLLTIGAIPVCVYVMQKLKKKAPRGGVSRSRSTAGPRRGETPRRLCLSTSACCLILVALMPGTTSTSSRGPGARSSLWSPNTPRGWATGEAVAL